MTAETKFNWEHATTRDRDLLSARWVFGNDISGEWPEFTSDWNAARHAIDKLESLGWKWPYGISAATGERMARVYRDVRTGDRLRLEFHLAGIEFRERSVAAKEPATARKTKKRSKSHA